jgi:hypothetical protein
MQDVGNKRARKTDRIEAAMGLEATVLDGDEGPR